MARLRLTGAVAVISAVLVLTGCGGSGQSETGGTTTPPPTSEASGDDAAAGTSAPTQAPDPEPAVPEQLRFTANTVDGKEFSGESLAGKPALLWFWAPWCPKCRAEAATIAEAAKNAGGVQFVGVAAQDGVPAMQEFVARYELGGFPHVADVDAAVWQRFGVTYQPAYAFIGSDGTVQMETEQLGKDELLARLGALR